MSPLRSPRTTASLQSRPRRITHAAVALLLIGPGPAAAQSQPAAPSLYYSVPSWAPDGKTISFESNREGEAAIYGRDEATARMRLDKLKAERIR